MVGVMIMVISATVFMMAMIEVGLVAMVMTNGGSSGDHGKYGRADGKGDIYRMVVISTASSLQDVCTARDPTLRKTEVMVSTTMVRVLKSMVLIAISDNTDLQLCLFLMILHLAGLQPGSHAAEVF